MYENEAEVKRRIISELQNLGATEFEQFCVSLLGPLGYQELQVTKRGADRGIDGHGLFRQGVVSIFALQSRRSVGARILLVDPKSTNSGARFKAITTTEYF